MTNTTSFMLVNEVCRGAFKQHRIKRNHFKERENCLPYIGKRTEFYAIEVYLLWMWIYLFFCFFYWVDFLVNERSSLKTVLTYHLNSIPFTVPPIANLGAMLSVTGRCP